MTKIPWTEITVNPWIGCTKVAEGCNVLDGDKWNNRIFYQWDQLESLLHIKKSRMVFLFSMSDPFHEKVPFEFIDKVMAVIALCPQHKFQILTKRPERMLEYFQRECLDYNVLRIMREKEWAGKKALLTCSISRMHHVWKGVSVSTQADADKNIPILLQIPAAVRFVSLEPMLERISFRISEIESELEYIDWVIIGCESGPKARLCSLEDIDFAIEQCRSAGMPIFLEQIPLNGKCVKDPAKWPEKYKKNYLRQYPILKKN